MTSKRKEFEKKYSGVINSIWEANKDNVSGTGDAADMLISSIRGHKGDTYTDGNKITRPFEIYDGIPEDFDWKAATADYADLVAE